MTNPSTVEQEEAIDDRNNNNENFMVIVNGFRFRFNNPTVERSSTCMNEEQAIKQHKNERTAEINGMMG